MPKINGTNANDVLVGSSEADEISAFAGDDVIYAGAGVIPPENHRAQK